MKTYQLIALLSTLLVAFAVMVWIISLPNLPSRGFIGIITLACFGSALYVAVRLHYRLFHTRNASPETK
jgi:hypothetical protein